MVSLDFSVIYFLPTAPWPWERFCFLVALFFVLCGALFNVFGTSVFSFVLLKWLRNLHAHVVINSFFAVSPILYYIYTHN